MTTRTPRSLLLALLLPGLGLLAGACGGGAGELPVLSDESTCEEVEALLDEAIGQARAYLGTDGADPLRADTLVLALSAADERPECVDEETATTARGLRTSIAS